MEKQKFKVLLYLKKGTIDKSGMTPIMGRITVNNSMAQFSCKLPCDQKLWNARESRLNGKSLIAVETNAKLDKLLLSINEAYETLQSRNKPFRADDVKSLFQGGIASQTTVLAMFQKVIDDHQARVGIDRKQGSVYDYIYAYRSLERFIKEKFNSGDIVFGQLNEQFIREFQDFILLKERYSVSVVRNHLIFLKKVCRRAFTEGVADKKHFAHYPLPNLERKPPRALSKEEFEAIRDLNIPDMNERCSLVRDMFLFSCYTGTPYIDVVAITKENLSIDEGGERWLIYKRAKNLSLSRVLLMPEAVAIIEKYSDSSRDTLFPYINYEKVRQMLRSIRSIIGMSGSLGYHQSRHTFSTLITLEQGVPIETVSKMLGHKHIITTQIYARVTQTKLFEDMDNFIEATADLQLTL